MPSVIPASPGNGAGRPDRHDRSQRKRHCAATPQSRGPGGGPVADRCRSALPSRPRGGLDRPSDRDTGNRTAPVSHEAGNGRANCALNQGLRQLARVLSGDLAPRFAPTGSQTRSARRLVPPPICTNIDPVEPLSCELNSHRTERGLRIRFRKPLLTCGAPLRNRTVDLLLTMDLRKVLLPQVGRLASQNTSTDQRPQAPDRPSRAPFATQSATQFDLASARRSLSEHAHAAPRITGSAVGMLRSAIRCSGLPSRATPQHHRGLGRFLVHLRLRCLRHRGLGPGRVRRRGTRTDLAVLTAAGGGEPMWSGCALIRLRSRGLVSGLPRDRPDGTFGVQR
jgi:hypothetical protein